MLIQRCAWHAFFRGYPRPLRVLSWRGRGITFTETICLSCADRVRIEGLWGSPPPPVWPGSAQTALLFVGLPLLTALVLLATPLHDAAPPMPRDETAWASAPDLPTPGPRLAANAGESAALPRAAVSRSRTARVPAVIYEARRTVYDSSDHGRAPTGGAAVRTSATPARVESRTAAFIPQSP